MIQPFTQSINERSNYFFNFIIIGSQGNKYDVKIEIDELDDDKTISMSCECPHCKFRQSKCKHIQEALTSLSAFQVEYRATEFALVGSREFLEEQLKTFANNADDTKTCVEHSKSTELNEDAREGST